MGSAGLASSWTWCRHTMRSRIEPMKKIARSLRAHRELILNYFRAKKTISSGTVEGLNNKAKKLSAYLSYRAARNATRQRTSSWYLVVRLSGISWITLSGCPSNFRQMRRPVARPVGSVGIRIRPKPP